MPTLADDQEWKRLEYAMAQDMIKHYDTLNWQIGSILIGAVIVLTGLVFSNDTIQLLKTSPCVGGVLIGGLPLISGLVLYAWYQWFSRHRELYNFRNEVLHRLEQQNGLYHYLRVAEAALMNEERRRRKPFQNKTNFSERQREIDRNLKALRAARKKGRHKDTQGENGFRVLFPAKLRNRPGHHLARWLAVGIPVIQILLGCAIIFAVRADPQPVSAANADCLDALLTASFQGDRTL